MAELLQPRGDPETRALKVPPHSIEAEQSVLGGVLLDKDAWLKVAERLRAEDFYRNDHRLIFEAISALDSEGKPFDIVTVAEWLENHRRLEEAGGLPYLAALVENTPSASNIGAYVDIVRKRSILRQLIRATTEISETVFNPQGRSSEEILDYAEQTVFQIAEQESRGRKGYRTIRELLAAAIDRVDELYRKKNPITGIATGFDDLDEKTGGLQRSDLIVIAGRPSMGKAQPLDAKVLMADGSWKSMGDLRLGDWLASPDGRPSRVSGLFPQGRRQAWRVTFSDGRSTECCDEHLWQVRYSEWDAPRVLTTAELRAKLRCARYRGRIWIDPPRGYFGHDEALPVDPYVLGLLLGDGKLSGGSVVFSTADAKLPELMAERLEETHFLAAAGGYDCRVVTRGGHHRRGRAGVVPNVLKESLRELGLWNLRSEEKFIPPCYLQANRQARLELLRGLLDTDDRAGTFGSVRFSSSSERLARDVVDLARSLGANATLRVRQPSCTYKGERRRGLPAYVCNIQYPDPASLFSLERRLARVADGRERIARLTIESIEPTRVAEMQCISVTHPSRLYVTDDYIVTHNTALAINIAEHAAIKDRCKVAIFSMEMPGEQLAMRMMASLGRIDQQRVRTGRLTDDDWPRLTASVSLMQDTKMFIDDTAALTPAELRARCRRLAREHGLDLVVVDYLQLMQVPGTSENRATEISEISRSLKAMAKELNVPVIALSQLNRSVEQRTDKRPVMSDLRESGAIEQDADVILFIYRDEVYDKESPDKGKAEIIIAKQRNGPIGTVILTFLGQYTKFENYTPEDPAYMTGLR
jgi:replicative DNA helicase